MKIRYNRDVELPPFRRPYQPPQNQPPLNLEETLKFDEIYSIFKALTFGPLTTHDDSRDSSQGDTDSTPLDEKQDQHLNTINCFSELKMVEEDES